MRSTTLSRSDGRQHRYVSPTSSLPFLPALPRIWRSIDGPTRSRPILALWRMTRLAGRLMPAARLQVATHTLRTPESYAPVTKSRSSVVRPAWWNATPAGMVCSSVLSRPVLSARKSSRRSILLSKTAGSSSAGGGHDAAD